VLFTAALIASSVKALLLTLIAGKAMRSSVVSPVRKGRLVEMVCKAVFTAVICAAVTVVFNRLFDKFDIIFGFNI
jgi:hypothetical protein